MTIFEYVADDFKVDLPPPSKCPKTGGHRRFNSNRAERSIDQSVHDIFRDVDRSIKLITVRVIKIVRTVHNDATILFYRSDRIFSHEYAT